VLLALSTSGAVGTIVADEWLIRDTVAVAAWHLWDRHCCEVVFTRPTTLRDGICETDDVARWYSRDLRCCEVAFPRPMTLRGGIRETDDVVRWHSRDC